MTFYFRSATHPKKTCLFTPKFVIGFAIGFSCSQLVLVFAGVFYDVWHMISLTGYLMQVPAGPVKVCVIPPPPNRLGFRVPALKNVTLTCSVRRIHTGMWTQACEGVQNQAKFFCASCCSIILLWGFDQNGKLLEFSIKVLQTWILSSLQIGDETGIAGSN